MMEILLGILALCVGVKGFIRSFEHKNLVIFIWIIALYYTLTSMVSICQPDNMYISDAIKLKYMANMFLCILSFYICDLVCNKSVNVLLAFNSIKKCRFFIVLEIVYWISYVLTFLTLKGQDYTSYNTGTGAGWAQVFFMFTSGIIYLFVLRKQWVKILLSAVMMVLIIIAIGVRSMFYFILMPIAFYYLYYMLFHVRGLKQFVLNCIPFAFLIFLASYLVSYVRFGYYSMPETGLTSIALNCLDQWNFGNQYLSSTLQYISGFLEPLRNALNMMSIHLPDFMENIPSVPQLNAMIYAGVSDVSDLENAYHMPATIFFDLMVSWGYFAPIAAFILYWYFLKVFNVFQKSPLRMILFSSIIGWHFYMLMRGAVDTCSSAMGYPLCLGIVTYFIITKLLLRKLS